MSEALHTYAPKIEPPKIQQAEPLLLPDQQKEKGTELFVQPKLTIGAPNDPYEKEADTVADKVMRMPQQHFTQCKHFASDSIQAKEIEGNRSVSFIQRTPSVQLQSQPPTSSTATPQLRLPPVRYRPTGIISRQEFDDYVRNNYGVSDIHTGTKTEQEGRITRTGVPTPTIPTWNLWDPGTSSEDYTSIIDGMEEMINILGAIPQIRTIIFFEYAYEPNPTTGVGVAQLGTGASFGAGELVIYKPFDGTTGAATGVSTTSGTPVRPRNRSTDISYIIIHELGHGVGEAGAAQNHQMFIQYNAAVGWIGNPAVLYDMGQPTVRAAVANGTILPSQHIITPARWNDPTVSEQPMSYYSVDGGPGEDFAEAVASYITNSSALQQRSPARYNFLHNNISTWRPQMRSMLPGLFPPPVGDFPEPSHDIMYA